MKNKTIALTGNPNCGKTTLFNGLTGSNQKIGNWPGVTVEKKSGNLLGHPDIEVVDLPGIYSFNSGSEDEIVARDFILDGNVDILINIVDATNLERNLFLTLALLEMGKPMILVLSMQDRLEKQGKKIDTQKLAQNLGIPVFSLNTLDNVSVRDFRRIIVDSKDSLAPAEFVVPYHESIEALISEWSDKFDQRYYTIMLLEEDEKMISLVSDQGMIEKHEIQQRIKTIEETVAESPDILIAESKFSLISNLCATVLKKAGGLTSASRTIDNVVLNRWLGVPIFLGIMFVLFWVVQHLGGAFIDFFDILFGSIFVDGIGTVLDVWGVPSWLNELIAGGLGGGIQTISTFVPIIFAMFFMLSLLEDSGYMSRAAFVMDRLLRSIGLPGKAFIPMLVGFGCTVPAVMATRTLENKKDRYLTVFIAPFMSCSARLPVYTLFGAAFFGIRSTIAIFAIYMTGIVLAIFTGLLLKNTLFKGEQSHFVMELPAYHTPRLRSVFRSTWIRLKGFIFRAGKVILIAVLVLSFFNSLGTDGSFGNQDSTNSVLATAGQAITPIFSPMGLEKENWPATVGLLTGIFAKEAVVGTISSMYQQIARSQKSGTQSPPISIKTAMGKALASIPAGLSAALGGLVDPLGLSITKGSENSLAKEIGTETGIFAQLRQSFNNEWTRSFAYMLFVLIYFPCLAAFAAITKEIGMAYGSLAAAYLTTLAWSISTLFFQITTGHNMFWIAIAILLLLFFVVIFNMISGRWRIFQKLAYAK